MGIVERGWYGGTTEGGRGSVLDATASLRNCDPRLAGKGSELASVAGNADGLSAARRSRRNPGGRFVDGFLGEQFALPVAVESLRAMRNQPLSGETITLSAADPLNLVGILVPGERVPAISGRTVSYRDGIVVVEDSRLAAEAVAG